MKNAPTVLAILTVIALSSLTNSAPALPTGQPGLLAAKDKAEKGEPFKGKVEAVDAEAKTLTVDAVVMTVTDTTKITKTGKEIKLADIKVGDQVHGKAHKTAEGKTTAIKIEVGGEKK